MESQVFWQELESRISKYDLLCHPFYKAWSAGQLTREDLREYAGDYYHHVSAFPTYLAALYARLGDTDLRRAVLSNLCEEEGLGSGTRPHSEMWLDFAEGMGADRQDVPSAEMSTSIDNLVEHFRAVAHDGTVAEALASFYAYESQVPRVAEEKARGLREMYSADSKTCGYFTLHAKADIHHSKVWRNLLTKEVEKHPESAQNAHDAAESAAKALWEALDGIDSERLARAA